MVAAVVLVIMPTSFFSWLAAACKATRENADITLAEVAHAANKDQSNIYRFEEGQSSPRDLEGVVAAYAKAIGVPAQMLWADALGLWSHANGNDREHLVGRALRLPQDGHVASMDDVIRRLTSIEHRLDRSKDTAAFEAVFRHSTGGIALLDRDLSYTRVNPVWARYTQREPHDLEGEKFGCWLDEVAVNYAMPLLIKALAGAPSFRERLTSGEQGRTWELTILPLDTPPIGLVLLSNEITAQEQIATLLQGL